eukprot:8215025-Ditylum_brightwellii.AAC.1
MVSVPSTLPGMPSDNHPNLLPVGFIHVAAFGTVNNWSMFCCQPLLLKIWLEYQAGFWPTLETVLEAPPLEVGTHVAANPAPLEVALWGCTQ